MAVAAFFNILLGVAHYYCGDLENAKLEYAKSKQIVENALGVSTHHRMRRSSESTLNSALTDYQRGEFESARAKLRIASRANDPDVAVDAIQLLITIEYAVTEDPHAVLPLVRRLDARIQRDADVRSHSMTAARTMAGQFFAITGQERGVTMLQEALDHWQRIWDEGKAQDSWSGYVTTRLELAWALNQRGKSKQAGAHVATLRRVEHGQGPGFEERLAELEAELAESK